MVLRELSWNHGSPPRMRGKPVARLQDGQRPRITPAHAGKTGVHGRGAFSAADHPRACGENGYGRLRSGSMDGSPPRMRGKLLKETENLPQIRITPAHAGKTISSIFELGSGSDHPRACGENTWSNILRVLDNGSPPRMRGKPSETFADGNTIRITPAHAGKTPAHRLCKSLRTDHPRACGENKNFPLQFLVAVGSPPRMRGKLFYPGA